MVFSFYHQIFTNDRGKRNNTSRIRMKCEIKLSASGWIALSIHSSRRRSNFVLLVIRLRLILDETKPLVLAHCYPQWFSIRLRIFRKFREPWAFWGRKANGYHPVRWIFIWWQLCEARYCFSVNPRILELFQIREFSSMQNKKNF